MTRIFVSYTRDDGMAVEAVFDELLRNGYADVFAYDLDGRGNRLGEEWHPALMAEARTCDVVVVLTGPASIASHRCTEEITVARERAMPARVFELVVAGTSGNPLLADRQRLTLTGCIDRLDMLIAALIEAGFEPSERMPRVESPYPGLRAFDADDAAFFHGRDELTTQIVDRLDGSTLSGGAMAVLGPSGVGKSSLVRAGVIARLRAGRGLQNRWFVCDPFTPGEKPLARLADSLDQAATFVGSASPIRGDPEGIAARLIDDDRDALLGELLAGDRLGRLMLVMDQAEELLSRSDQTEVGVLAATLDAIVASRRAWLLYTLRSDFLTDLLRSVSAGRLVGESVLVPVLGPKDLSAAIAAPARSLGYEYQPEAIASMIMDIGDSSALPLLAYALDRLFRRVRAQRRADRTITLDDYLASGSVRDVLTQQADLAFDDAVGRAAEQLAAEGGEAGTARRRVLRLLRRLMSIRGGVAVRRSISLDGIGAVERAILEPFVLKRVVSFTEQSTAEVTHEALLTSWPRLSDELDELREALQARADIERRTAEWHDDREKGQPGGGDDGLLPVTRLLAFLDIVRRGADLELDEGAPTDGWGALQARLSGLDLAEREIEYISLSLQHALDEEVTRIGRFVEADAFRAGRELLGRGSDLQRDLMAALLEAPDLGPLVELLHATMAANPVHLVVEAHPKGAWGAAWDPDGTRFATAGRDQTVRVWRQGDHGARPVLEMRHGNDSRGGSEGLGWVRSVAWSSDGRFVLSVATDEAFKVWDAVDGGEVRSHLHPDRLWSVQTPQVGGIAVTAGADGVLRIYPLERRASGPEHTLPVGARLWAAALSPDGTCVAAACEDGHAYVIELADPGTPRLRLAHPDKVRSITWSPDGMQLATGCQDGVGRVFDVATENLVHELTGHHDQIRAIRWSPSGQRLATGSADLDIHIWDAATGQSVAVLSQHDQGVCALDWAPAGDRLLSAADDGTARIWKIGSDPTRSLAFDRPVTAIAWHPGSGHLAVATAENTRTAASNVQLIATNGALDDRPAAEHDMPVVGLAWTVHGDLVTASTDQTAARWRNGRTVASYTGARDGMVAALPSPTGELLLGASRDRVIRLWTLDGSLHMPDNREWHDSFLTDAAWDGAGLRFAVVSDDHQMSVHSVVGGPPDLTDAGGRLTSVAWNGITDEIAVGRGDGVVVVYGCAVGLQPEFRRHINAHSRAVTDLAWSPDGALLCVGSQDGRASIWDTRSGAQRTLLVGHVAAVSACLWTAARAVITAGADGQVRWWDVTDGDRFPTAGIPHAEHGVRLPAYARRLVGELRNRAGDPRPAAG